MDYFLVKQKRMETVITHETIEEEQATVCKVNDVKPFQFIDYIKKGNLVSERLKVLLEMYQPKEVYRSFIYFDLSRQQVKTFWYWKVPEYQPEAVTFGIDGCVESLEVDRGEVKRMFQVSSPKGITSTIIHLSVAESILRRGYLGLELVPVC